MKTATEKSKGSAVESKHRGNREVLVEKHSIICFAVDYKNYGGDRLTSVCFRLTDVEFFSVVEIKDASDNRSLKEVILTMRSGKNIELDPTFDLDVIAELLAKHFGE